MQLTPLWKNFSYKEHQTYGVHWLLSREQDTIKGGILCDEMGLGKTIQMLGLIKESLLYSTLLVAPLAVINQWKQTAERANIRCFTYDVKKSTWILQTRAFPNSKHLYLIGYECLANNILSISAKNFDRIICDEAHRLGVHKIRSQIKNPSKLSFKIIRTINATSKWFLTATPVVNSIDDVYSLFALLDPSLITEPIESLMSSYALGRTMAQMRSVVPDAPSVPSINNHVLEFVSKEEEEFYVSIQNNIEKQLSYSENALIVLRLILMLRQLSIHPQVYIEARKKKIKNVYNDWTEPSTKFIKIRELLIAESHECHKWIIFCHFHDEMNMLKEYISKIDCVRNIETYSGCLNCNEKTDALDRVRKPFSPSIVKKCDVLLIQLKAGGVGLNLQEFDRIIFSSPWWTQAALDQGIGRAVRIGQQKQVVVHNLILKQEEAINVRNIDKWMKKIAQEKDEINKMILRMADTNII